MPLRELGRRVVMAIAAVLLVLTPIRGVSAQSYDPDASDVQSSFSELDRYGSWIQHPEWGTVWSPDVDGDWRPYTRGRWVWTEEHGWYWDSDEPFGWAVFHYGRWVDDPEEGWIWIPGTEWGPAWVGWRYGDEAVGWAPLPPGAIWNPDQGVVIDDEFYHGPSYAPFWIFVTSRYLLYPSLHRYVMPLARNPSFFTRTRPATHYGFDRRHVFNHGIPRHEVERLTQSRVPTLGLLSASRPGFNRRGSADAIPVFRPAIVPSQRWQTGSRGDWRRFEPNARPAAARPDRPRPESIAPDRRSDRGVPDRDLRDRDPRDRDVRDRYRRDFDRAPSGRFQRPDPIEPRVTRPSPSSTTPTVPRSEPPRRSFDQERPRHRDLGPSRDFERRSAQPRERVAPPPRQTPPPQPRVQPPPQRQVAPPPQRPAPPPQRSAPPQQQHRKPPPQ